MDALETLIRDTLREHAVDAPMVLPPVHEPRPRRWLYAGIAAVLVAGLAVAITVLRGGGATTSPAGDRPTGYRWVSYHGITLAVPEQLPRIISTCGAWQDAVVVSDGVGHGCGTGPPHPPPIDIQVLLDSRASYRTGPRSAPVRIDGVRALRGNAIVAIPSLDVVVRVVAPAGSDIVARVLDSIRITPIDALGCPDRLAGNFDQPRSEQPVAVSVCEYGIGSVGSTEWLVASGRAAPGQITALAGATRDEPDPAYPTPYVGVFRYADGMSRFVPLSYSALVIRVVR